MVNADKSFTGIIRLQGQAFRFKAQLDARGGSEITIPRAGRPPLLVAFRSIETPAARIHGEITADGRLLEFEAFPAAFTGNVGDQHPLAGGRFNVILQKADADMGNGFFAMIVNAKGAARLVGKLADRTAFTIASYLGDGGSTAWLVAVHGPLYLAKTGMLWGELILRKAMVPDGPDLTGRLDWLRPPNARLFHDAFLLPLDVAGERYPVPAMGISVITGWADSTGFSLSARSVDGEDIVQSGIWPATNRPSLTPPVAAGMNIEFSQKNGVLKGTFMRMIDGKGVKVPYEGLMLTESFVLPGFEAGLRGAGFFWNTGAGGSIEVAD